MKNFQIGQTVKNLGELAKVVGFHEEAGLLILKPRRGGKWMADPAKCEPTDMALTLENEIAAYREYKGLAVAAQGGALRHED